MNLHIPLFFKMTTALLCMVQCLKKNKRDILTPLKWMCECVYICYPSICHLILKEDSYSSLYQCFLHKPPALWSSNAPATNAAGPWLSRLLRFCYHRSLLPSHWTTRIQVPKVYNIDGAKYSMSHFWVHNLHIFPARNEGGCLISHVSRCTVWFSI